MSKCSRILSGAMVVAALAVGGQAFAINNANVPPPGYPDWWSYNGSATLTQSKSTHDFTFTYTDIFNTKACSSSSSSSSCPSAVFNFQNGAYKVSNLDLVLTAVFGPNGQFLSGNYSISGAIPPWNNPTYGTKPRGFNWTSTTSPLFTATLTGANVNMQTDELGFTTSGFGGWSDQKQFTGNSTSESVWVYAQLACQTANQNQPLCTNSTNYGFWNSFLAQLKNGNLNVTGNFKGLASIATVPIPAAALLLGSGLASLGAALRRRKLGVVAA